MRATLRLCHSSGDGRPWRAKGLVFARAAMYFSTGEWIQKNEKDEGVRCGMRDEREGM